MNQASTIAGTDNGRPPSTLAHQRNQTQSMMSFDSINVRKTTQTGIRSSAFFLTKPDISAATKKSSNNANMIHKRTSQPFERISITNV